MNHKSKIIKTPRILLQATVTALEQIFIENRYADKVIEKTFREHSKFGSRDRRFVAEATYNIVRNFRLISHLAHHSNDFWELLGVYFVVSNFALPGEREFQKLNKEKILFRLKETNDIKIKESYPDWLWELCEKELGKEVWNRESKALNEEAKVILRTNTLKTTKKDLLQKLKETDVEVEEIDGYRDALLLVNRQNIFTHPLFKLGLFELQDVNSQEVALFLDAKPGLRVVDACAGGGGKTLHIAAFMENKGKIISMDIADWKLVELKKRAKRAGAFNIETRLIEGSKSIKRLENTADKLLLDVPCSGTGVIKRNPDAKWKLSLEFIEEVKGTQAHILNTYTKMLKNGGHAVYSTCSILPSENGLQVQAFLQQNPNFILLQEKTMLPSEGYDGFYMALLQRVS